MLSSGSLAYAADTQTQANNNECNTGTNCAITSPQTQGDGTANSPINTQTIESKVPTPNSIPPTVGDAVLLLSDCEDPGGPLFFLRCNIFLDFQKIRDWVEIQCRSDLDRGNSHFCFLLPSIGESDVGYCDISTPPLIARCFDIKPIS